MTDRARTPSTAGRNSSEPGFDGEHWRPGRDPYRAGAMPRPRPSRCGDSAVRKDTVVVICILALLGGLGHALDLPEYLGNAFMGWRRD